MVDEKDLAPMEHNPKVERVAKGDPTAKVKTAAEAAQMTPDLPPAGYARDEQLIRNAEELAAAKAELESHDTFHAPLKDFTAMEDRDILKYFGRDPFTGEQNIQIDGLNERDYAYSLVLCKLPRSGRDHRMVDLAKRFGWELVKASTSHTTEDGKPVAVGWNLPIVDELLSARGVADTVLMYMPRERYEALQELARRYSLRRQRAAQATSLFNAQGARGHSELDDPRGYVGTLLQREGGAVAMSQVPTAAMAMDRGLPPEQAAVVRAVNKR